MIVVESHVAYQSPFVEQFDFKYVILFTNETQSTDLNHILFIIMSSV